MRSSSTSSGSVLGVGLPKNSLTTSKEEGEKHMLSGAFHKSEPAQPVFKYGAIRALCVRFCKWVGASSIAARWTSQSTGANKTIGATTVGLIPLLSENTRSLVADVDKEGKTAHPFRKLGIICPVREGPAQKLKIKDECLANFNARDKTAKRLLCAHLVMEMRPSLDPLFTESLSVEEFRNTGTPRDFIEMMEYHAKEHVTDLAFWSIAGKFVKIADQMDRMGTSSRPDGEIEGLRTHDWGVSTPQCKTVNDALLEVVEVVKYSAIPASKADQLASASARCSGAPLVAEGPDLTKPASNSHFYDLTSPKNQQELAENRLQATERDRASSVPFNLSYLLSLTEGVSRKGSLLAIALVR